MFKTSSDRTPMQRLLAAWLIVLQVLSPVLYAGNAWAQVNNSAINPDRSVPGQRPVVNVAANGVPVVQISPPSAAGVSNNRFTDYNVSDKGVILNNSGANNQTQLGGWVAGNPMLGNSSARVILNQVTGATPSSLTGFTEVAGNQANVIVANPNGITCDGCGFINAPRATLTTGIPKLGTDGGVLGFQVQRGQISIEGKGLATGNVDQVDLISRSLRLNAGVWAGKLLNVVTGTNQVDYESGQVAAQGASDVPPAVSLDVSQLGSMYANSIRLIGTENGVGVNSAGKIEALTGTLEINQAGDVRITGGHVQAAGDLTMRSGQDIVNAGVVYTPGKVGLQAQGTLQNTGALGAGNDVKGQVGSLQNSGDIRAGADTEGKIISPNDVSIAASGTLQNSGQILAGNNLTLTGGKTVLDKGTLSANNQAVITAGATLDNRNAQIYAADIAISAAGKLDNTNSKVESRNLLTVTAPSIDNTNGSLRQATDADSASKTQQGIVIRSVSSDKAQDILINDQGIIASNGTVSLDVAAVSNINGTVQATGGLTLVGERSVDNKNGKLLAGDSLSVTTAGQFTNGSGQVTGNQAVAISAGGGLVNDTGNIQGTAVQLQSPSISNAKGSIVQTGSTDQSIQMTGTFDNSGGTFATNAENISLGAGSITNTAQGKIAHGGKGRFDIAAADSLDNTGGTVSTNGQLALSANSLMNTGGNVTSIGNMSITANTVTNTVDAVTKTKGVLATGGDLNLSASGALANMGGTIQADKGVTVTAGSIANANGIIYARQNMTTTVAADVDNQQGVLQSEGQLLGRIGGGLGNQQGMVQGGSLDLQAGSIANGNGHIQQVGTGTAEINVAGTLDNAAGSILGSGSALNLSAGNINNQSGIISHAGGGVLDIQSGGTIDNAGGKVLAGGQLQVNANDLNNGLQGLIQSASSTTLTTKDGIANNSGTIFSGTAITINAGGNIGNASGKIEAGTAAAISANNLDNTAGRIASLGDGSTSFNITQTLNNTWGTIGANGSAAINSSTFNNTKGTVTTKEDLGIVVDKFVNKDGKLNVGGALSLQITDAFDNRGNTLEAPKGLTISAASIDNGTNERGVAGRMAVTGNGLLKLEATSGGINNAGGFMGSNGNVTLKADNVANTGGTVYARQAIAITTAAQVNNSQGTLQADAELTARIGGMLGNQQGLVQASRMDLQAGSLDNSGAGQLLQLGTGANVVSVTGALNNAQGTIASNGRTLSIAGGSIDNSAGVISHAGDGKLSIASNGTLNNNGGKILTAGEVVIDAQQISNNVQAGKAGLIQSGGAATINASGDINNSNGSIISGAALKVQAQGDIQNGGGLLQAANALTLQGTNIVNKAGSAISLDNSGVTVTAGNVLANDAGGFIGGNGNVGLGAGSVNNAAGTVYSRNALTITTDADVNNTQGTLQADAKLTARIGGMLGNQQGLVQASRMDLQAGSLNNSTGQLLQLGDSNNSISVVGALTNIQGTIASKSGNLAVTTGSIDNGSGSIVGAAALTVQAQGDIDNSNGTVEAARALALQGANINNTAGRIASLDDSGVSISAINALTNDQGTIGGNGVVAINAGTISNIQGKISGVTHVAITADAVNNSNGSLVAGDTLNAQVSGALNNAGGIIQAAQTSVTAGSLGNSSGQVLATGTGPLAVTLAGDADNTGGFIGGNGDVALAANNINNTGGTVYAKKAMTVTSADQFNNTQGVLQADAELAVRAGGAFGNQQGLVQASRMDVQAGSLNNKSGQLLQLGNDDSTIRIAGALGNAQGVIGANGSNLTIAAADIDNSAGAISHAGTGKLDIGSNAAVNNNGGKILTAGEIAINAKNVSNNLQDGKGGLIQAARSATVSASGDARNVGGTLISGAALTVQAQGNLSNAGGTLQAANALTLQGANIDNTAGSAVSLDDSGVTVYAVSGLTNDQGIIGGNGAVAINAGAISNNQGKISGVTDLDITAGSVNNGNGNLVAGRALNIQVSGALNNAGGNMQAAQTSVTAGSLDNSTGKMLATGSSPLAVTVSGDANNNGGFIGGKGDINLAANNLDNTGGTIYAGRDLGINTNKLDNSTGTLQADEKFAVNLTEELINKQGVIQANRLAIQAPSLDNTAGKILQLGTDDTNLIFNGALNNAQGTIATNGQNLKIAGSSIDNSAGSITHAGDGKFDINSNGTLNNDGGKLLTAGAVAIDAGSVSNSLQGGKGGVIQAGKSAAITASGDINNRSGSIEAANALMLQGANIDNTAGSAVSLDGSGMSIGAINALTNDQGTIGGNGAVAVNAGTISNIQGKISGVTHVAITADAVNNSNGKLVAGDTLNVQMSGALNNTGGTIQATQIDMTAGSLGNSTGQVLATGTGPLVITVTGDTDNTGGFIGGNGDVALAANNINNTSGTIYAKKSLSIDTHKLDNTKGTLQADEKLSANLTEELVNKQGVIQANEIAIQAPSLDNTAGKILQLGAADTNLVFNGAINNKQGTIAANGSNLTIVAADIDNSAGTISHAGAGKLDIGSNAEVNNNGGKILTAGEIAINAKNVSNNLQDGKGGLIQAARSATVSASGDARNVGGTLISGAALTVQAQGNLSNAGGTLQAANALTLQGANIDNTAGSAVSLDDSGVTVYAVSSLTNDQGAIGGNGAVAISATNLSNAKGKITGIDNVDVVAANIDNSGGTIESRKHLTIDTGDNGSLNNTQQGLLQGEQLNLHAPNFTNAGGSLIQTGTADTTLQFNGKLDNSNGVIASNGNKLTINAQGLDNDQGLIKHGGTDTLTLTLPGSISNNGGTISSNGNAVVGATTISNTAQGRIEAAGTLAVNAGTSFNNNGGLVQSNGALTLTTPAMSNAGGAVYSNNRLTLAVPGFDNTGGMVSGDQLSFLPMSRVRNSGGTIIQSGAGDLNFIVSQDVDNTGGTIAANGNLTVSGSSVNNQSGTLRAAGSGTLTVTTGGTLNNVNGIMAAGGALQASGASINNQSGQITSGQQLNVTSGGGINNDQGTIAANGNATLNGSSLSNRNGIAASVSGTLALNTPASIDNTGGRLESGRDLTLNVASLTNTQGTITGDNVSIDTQGTTLESSGGKIAARGALNIKSGQLNNSGGLLQAAGAMTVDTNGQTLTNTQSGSSAGIVGLNAVTLKTGNLNNQGGYIGAQGALQVNASGSVDNSGGSILGKSTVLITATGLNNSNGQLQGYGDVTLGLSSGTLNNNGGLVRAGGTLTVNAGSIVNTNTTGSNQGIEGSNVTLNAATLDNSSGAMHADNQFTVNGTSLNNTNGTISSANILTDNAASITNSGGTLIAAQKLAMNSPTVIGSGQYLSNGDLDFNYSGDYTNTSRLVAAGNMTFASGGTITNSGQIGANNTLNLSAASLNNQAGGEISAGATNIAVSGTINNQGLIDGTQTTINAGTINNSNRIYGTNLTVNAGAISNTGAAVIGSRGDMALTAGTLTNSGGATLLSIGNMTLGGGSVVNGSSLIEAHGNLTITAGSVTNRNDTITMTTQNLGSEHIVQYQPSGWTSPLASSAVGFNGYDDGRLVLDSTTYPIARYGTTYYASAVVDNCQGDSGCGYLTFTYDSSSPVWALFGVTPPGPQPSGSEWCNSEGGFYGTECNQYQIAFQQWTAEMQARSNELNQKINAFNNDLSHRMVEDWYVIDATRTTTQTTVQNSTPGRILVGGNLTLSGPAGSVTNDKSQIIVGGSIGGTAANVKNEDAKAEKKITDVGTKQFTELVSCGWFGDDHCREWRTPGPYSTTQPVTLDGQAVIAQPVMIYQQNTNPGANNQADALKVISVNQNASGAADASGSVGNRQSAAGSTAVNGVAAAGSAAHTDGSQAGGTNVATVQGQAGGNGTQAAGADVFNTVNTTTGATVSGSAQGGIAAASAGVSNAINGNAGTGVASTTATSAIGNTGAAVANAVNGNTGTGISGSLPDSGSAHAATTVTGNAQADAVNSAGSAASNAIAAGTGSSAPASLNVSAQTVAVTGAQANQANSAAKNTVAIGGASAGDYTIRTSTPNTTLSNSALYLTHTEPGPGHLVETDPRFTQYRDWLSSDYMLQQFNNDPARALKRLGDGFYEQKLVADQIMLATGYRFTGDYTNNEDEYKALMEAGVDFGRQYQLTVGVALTAEQMKQLTGDIVWLVKQDVKLADGSVQSVLAPQVYLRVKEGDIKGDGTLISAREIKLDLTGDLNNNALIASKNLAQITADNINNTDGGRINAATLDLTARTDLNNLSGTIAGNVVSLGAGRDINIRTTTIDSKGLNTSRTDLAQMAGVTGDNITIAAGRDLTIAGAQINASGDALLAANRALAIDTVQTKTGLDLAVSGHIKEDTVSNTGSRIAAGGNLTIASALKQDGDLTVRGSALSAGNALTVAGTNVKVESAIDSRSVDMLTQLKHGTNSINEHVESAVASELNAGGNLTVVAKGSLGADGKAIEGTGDLTFKGAQLTSTSGAVTLAANNDVNLIEQQLQQSRHDESTYRGGTLVSKVSSDSMKDVQTTQSVATTVSGGSVIIGAGHDITARGATVVADNDVSLLAKNDIKITASQDTTSSAHNARESTSGLFSNGGASITLGKQQQEQAQTGQSVTNTGSQIASLNGNVTLTAGRTYTQTGSQVLAPQGDIGIAAQQIDIAAATDTTRSTEQQHYQQSGLSVSLSSPVISALQSAAQMSSAAGKTSDPRMKALAAATAALSVKDAANAVQTMAQDPKAGVGINISLGGSKSDSRQEQSSSTSVGSKIAAGGNISIEAAGAGSGSTLNVTGSDILAGGAALLKADGAINLSAAQNKAEQHSTNSGSSAGVGIGINFGGSQNGISFNASASQSRGHADGTDIVWTNTHVSGSQVGIASGGDTTLKGAVVSGGQVTADIKGNLNIESLQDTSTYDSKQQSAGVGVSVCVPPFCYGASSVSASYSNAHANGNYAGVTEQSGIQARDGGFQVQVKGNTDLKGGVIASSDKAVQNGKNSLTTATLTASDIQNRDSHDAGGISLGVTVSGKMGDQSSDAARKNMTEADQKAADSTRTGTSMTPGLGQVSGTQASVTQSGISAGAIVIADEQGQKARTGQDATATAASLNRNVVSGKEAGNALVKQWNGQQLMEDVQAQMQITSAALPRMAKEIGDYARDKAAELRKQGNEAEAKKWDEGGVYHVAAHAALGALGGGLAGAAGAGASAAAASALNELQDKLQNKLAEAGLSDGAAKTAAQLIAGSTAAAIGGAAGGGAGAITALNADANNRQLHPDERKFISNKAKELAAQTCKAGDTQCLTSAQRYWSDQLTAEAEAADDSKLAQQRNRYLSQVAATGQIPGMEGQTSGAAMKYLQDAQIARNALSEIKGQTILGTDGKPIMADGSTLIYFSGTQAQRDDHNLYAVRPGMYDTRVSMNGSVNEVVSQQDIMLRTQRDNKRLTNLSATNGAALPDYPVEEFVLGGGPGLVKGAAETVLSLARKSVAGSVDKAAVDAALAKAAESSSSAALPEGYAPLKSVGAAANDTGGLPAGFRRVVNQATGDVQVLGSDGRIYNEVTQGGKDVLVPVTKGAVTSEGMANAATTGKLNQQLANESLAAAGTDMSNIKVVAQGKIEGRVYIDTNQGARSATNANAAESTLVPADRVATRIPEHGAVNGDMSNAHAEIGVIQQASKAGVAKGADMTMTVSGEPVCGFCRGDIPAAAQAAGLKSLTIYEEKTGQTFFWQSGMTTLRVKKP